MLDVEQTLKYPAGDQEWVVKTVIGAVLNLIPIVNFLAAGYLLEVTRMGAEGREGLPVWENWGDKFINGLLVFVISLIYMLIPMIIMGLGGFSGMAGFMRHGYEGYGMAGFGFMMVLGTILALVIGFFMPMALTHFAVTGNFGAAFEFSTILERIKAVFGSYLVTFVLFIVLVIVISMVLGIIPVLGVLISLFVNFYLSMAFFYQFGRLYTEAGNSGPNI